MISLTVHCQIYCVCQRPIVTLRSGVNFGSEPLLNTFTGWKNRKCLVGNIQLASNVIN